MAPDDIAGHESWPRQIVGAITRSSVMIVLLSTEALDSEHVGREVNLAMEQGKPVLPVRISDVKMTGTLAYLLSLLQWIDAFPLPLAGYGQLLVERIDVLLTETSQAAASTDLYQPRRPKQASHNLPAQVTSFVGREQELAEIEKLIHEFRLVTLTGVGGVGKTRLALETATDLAREFPDGAWLVTLDSVFEGRWIPSAIARVLGIDESHSEDLLVTIGTRIRERQMLLIFDNCEHLIEECATTAGSLLASAPGLRILATSRETLGVSGEVQFGVPPLTAPPMYSKVDAAELHRYGAMELLVERCRAVSPDFELTNRNVGAISEICQRLDGIPLAIELAAARTQALSLPEISSHLSERFRFLTGGSRASLPRHRTLRAAIQWSHDLLSDSERQAFAQLSTFQGFSLDAAIGVLETSGRDGWSVIDLVGALVDKSLVLVERSDSHTEVRYRMLETIREFAREQLVASGDDAAWRERHARWYVSLTREVEDALLGGEADAWFLRLDLEGDNLRAALRWAIDQFDFPMAVRLAVQLAPYWEATFLVKEGYAWMSEVLSKGSSNDSNTALLALWASSFAHLSGNSDQSAKWRELYRSIWPGDPSSRLALRRMLIEAGAEEDHQLGFRLLCDAIELARNQDTLMLHDLLQEAAILAVQSGDPRAEEMARERLHLALASGQHCHLHMAHGLLGYVALQLDNVQLGREQYELARRESELANNAWGIAMADNQLARAAIAEGRLRDARTLAAGALEIFEDLGIWTSAELVVARLVDIELAAGDAQAALRWAQRLRPTGRIEIAARVTSPLAEALGQLEEAVTLHGFLKAAIEQRGLGFGVDWHRQYEEREVRLKAKAAESYASLEDRGKVMSTDDVWMTVSSVLASEAPAPVA
jgi:non-specific serine/threonine protein kinase